MSISSDLSSPISKRLGNSSQDRKPSHARGQESDCNDLVEVLSARDTNIEKTEILAWESQMAMPESKPRSVWMRGNPRILRYANSA